MNLEKMIIVFEKSSYHLVRLDANGSSLKLAQSAMLQRLRHVGFPEDSRIYRLPI